MFPLITIAVLVFTAAAVMLLRVARPGLRLGWPAAAVGALVAWLSTFVWQVDLPQKATLGPWLPASIYTYSPSLLADGTNFPYALGLTALALGIVWTSAARSATTSPVAWASTLALTALGLIGVLAGNILTLLLALAAIDLLELINTLRVAEDPTSSESAVIVFSIQLVGLGLIIWGALVASAAGTVMEFDAMPAYGGLYLLLGASVRIFANLYRQPYALEPGLRRGYGTAMRLISAAASLSLVARIPPGSISLSSTTWLLVFAALVGLISGVYWLRAPSLIEGRRFLVAGLASLAFATTLQGNHVGSAAWGSALILAGGLASLYSVHQRRLAVLLLGAGFVLTALPFTLTASGWQRASEPPWFFWLLYLPVQALILAGYVTSIVRPAETALEGQPSWGRVIYPAGLLLLALSGLVLGFFGWDGARQPGVLPAALVATVLGGTLGWLFWRLPGLQRAVEPVVATGERLTARPAPLFGALAAGVWSLYRFLRRLAGFAAAALEGDGGLLWAVVVLVLLVSAFQVALR